MVCLRAQQVNNKHSVCGMGSPKFVDILPKEHLPHQTQLLIITNSLRLHMCASKLWTVLYTVHVLMHLWKNSSCEMCISARRAMATVDETAVMFSTSDILFWLTGSRHLPAVGFCSPIKVHFYNDPLPHVRAPVDYMYSCQCTNSSMQGPVLKVITGWILDLPGFGHI